MNDVSQASRQLMGALVGRNYDAGLRLIGADPSLIDQPLDDSGRLPFQFFVRDADYLQRFLALGADPNQRGKNEQTPIFHASSPASAQLLIASGADVHARDRHGRTVLFRCKEDLLDLYLAHGVEINAQDHAGRTAAHERSWSVAPLEALVGHGASLMIADHNGATPLHTCREAVKLQEHPPGLDWNLADANGDTPLHYAVRGAASWWIHRLRELGAVDRANHAGKKPMDLVVGQLVVGKRLPAPVSMAALSCHLYDGQLNWYFESVGFGISVDDGPVESPEPHELVDFRLYSEDLHALAEREFSHWPEVFDEPVVVDAGAEKNAALYRYEHEPVDDSTIMATNFSPTSCDIEWRGARDYFEDFHLQCRVEFDGFAVLPDSAFGREANSSRDSFRQALLPYLPEFDVRYTIVPVDEHGTRFRALPKTVAD